MKTPRSIVLGALACFASAAACTNGGGGGKDSTPTPTPVAAVFVSTSGLDTNAGISPDDALATIQEAMVVASSLGLVEVRVSAGTFEANQDAGNAVFLRPGIALLGGWAADFTLRDPATNLTVLQSTATVGNDPDSLDAAIVARGSHIGRDARVDGFTIRGGSGNNGTGVVVAEGAGPTFTANVIEGGSATTSIGAAVRNGGAPLFRGNVIRGGTATNNAFGAIAIRSGAVFEDNIVQGGSSPESKGFVLGGSAIVRGNTIDGGTGTNTTGIDMNTTGALIENNLIRAGAGTAVSHGIRNDALLALIRHNTVDGGGGTTEAAALVMSAQPSVENNILFTSGGVTRRCVSETASVAPVVFRNNDLFDCPTALYRNEGTTDITDIATVNSLSIVAFSANVSVAAGFEGANLGDFHLGNSSPASVSEGGVDFTAFVLFDRDGAARTSPPSMGAFERD